MSLPALLRRATVALVAVTALAGCFTGQRPVLSQGPEPTGDPAADALLERLPLATTATFSASYTIETTQEPPRSADATVVQDGPSARSVTIGSTRFVVALSETATCDTETDECTESIDDARVSDLLVSSSFYGATQANRVRNDVRLRTGSTVASTETIAGQRATCVTIPVATATSTYCALDNGVLARLTAADLRVEMTRYAETADPAELVMPPLT